MRNPDVWTALQIQKWDASTSTKNRGYIPTRPLPWYGPKLFHNIKIAYYVFIGKYDALDWEEDK